MNAEGTDRDPQTYAVIGAAMEVHKVLHAGFLETVYQDALAVELLERGIPFERERLLQVRYKGGILPSCYRADFVCFEGLLVECKAIQKVGAIEEAQILNYLRVTGFCCALVLNFGARSLEYRRFVSTAGSDSAKRPLVDFRL